METVREGKAEVLVPSMSLTRKSEAFYNPAMEYQRDVTMSALRAWRRGKSGGLSVCDPLAGTGIRGIRIALEVPGISRILMNDSSPRAAAVMRKNVARNGIRKVTGVSITSKDANALFLEHAREFDFIDLDPFGSPIGFVPNAGHALRPRSLLACTATDTGALCGTFPSTCLTRYGIAAVKTGFFKETGVRVLATAVMIELARHGLAFTPLYSHANHYFRVIGEARRSKSLMASRFREVGFVSCCGKCLHRSLGSGGECPLCGSKTHVMGPLWTGRIKDTAFCRDMLEDLGSAGYRKTRELVTCTEELDVPFHYDLPSVFRALKRPPVRTDEVMRSLRSRGYRASRTHLSDAGIKTDAPCRDVMDAARG